MVSTAIEIAQKEGIQEITEVNIRLGELQHVEVELFEFALSQVRTPMLERARFKIRRERARFVCRSCRHEWGFDAEEAGEDAREAVHFVPELAHAFTRCPECGSRDFEIAQGRGIWLDSIKGEK